MRASVIAVVLSDSMTGVMLASRYVLDERIGDGGMGTVYRARHARIGRVFAIKVLHRRLSEKAKLVRRFHREAEIAARLRHPNVAAVIDQGDTDDGLHFLVMELAPGRSLADLLGGAPMPADRAIPLIRQMCDGLQHAHDAGLVHRDFKPENVIVEAQGDGREIARIVDFGVAILRDDVGAEHDRLTTAGIAIGTPHYMAPEQVRGDALDHRADLFALGLVCYEMLTGRLPFEGTGVEVAHANLERATPPMGMRTPTAEIDPLLEELVQQLLAKDPAQRPQSASAVREVLDLIVWNRSEAAVRLGVVPADDTPGAPVAELEPPPAPSSAPAAYAATAMYEPVDTPLGMEAVHITDVVGGMRPIAADEPAPMPRPLAIADPARSLSTERVRRRRNIDPTAIDAPAIEGDHRRRVAIAAAVALAVLVAMLGVALLGGKHGASSTAAVTSTPEVAAAPFAAPEAELPWPLAPPPSAREAPPGRPRDPDRAHESFAPAPAPTSPPAPSAPATPTAAEVATLYGMVGRELKALDAAKGQEATYDLWPRFRWIRINEYLLTPERRLIAAALLARLHTDITTRDRGSAGG